MDLVLSIIIFVASIFCFILLGRQRPLIRNGVKGPRKMVPEAKGAWPIIGHLHLLAGPKLPHKVFGALADKFGPIFTIKFGVHRVLIVSNSELAKECLTTNDRVFASRPKAMVTELMGYNYAMFGLAPYGPYWREIRKIVVLDLGSHSRLQMLAHIRACEVNSSIIDMYRNWIRNKGSSETVMIDLKQWSEDLIENMVVKMIFGSSFRLGEQNGKHFKKAIKRFIELLGVCVPSDAMPGLRWLDLGGYLKTMKKTAKEMDIVIDSWLKERKQKMNPKQQLDEIQDQVFMDSLLSRVKELNEDLYGVSADVIVKATCLAIFVAATDTTTVTLIWALSLLVNNPFVLKIAQQELEDHVGKDRKVEESDLKNLVYLQAIIKETMRLYPAVPLLLPHESIEDCHVGGYMVPKGTRLFVNVWKIQHDPQIWTDPFEFQPDRFLTCKNEIDVKGQNIELIPFGRGRRICPGISFSLQALQLILASIIHCFEFQNPLNEPVDMTESRGITNFKATPLELLVTPRLSPNLYGLTT